MMSHFAFLTATIAGPAFLFSGVSLSDPITLLPSVLLFALGLVFGLLITRSNRREPANDTRPEPIGEAETLVDAPAATPPAPEADPEALRVARAELGEARLSLATLEGELAASRRLSESQGEEIQLLGERFSLLRQQLEDKSQRLSALTPSVGGPVTPHAVLSQVKLPVDQLAEAVHGERQLLGGCLARLEHLEARMREEDRRFRQAGEALSRTRDEVGGRLSDTAGTGPALFALADRLSQVDDQLRVLGQNVSGCVSRIQSAREHLQSEQGKLREAAQPIQEAEKSLAERLASDESVDIAPLLDEVRSRLTEASGHVATLENGIDQEIAEMIGRVDWTVRDSPAGFLKALDRLNDGESGGDLATSWIESRVWRDLNELRGALSGIQVTLETGAIAAPATGCGKRRLIEAADRAVRSIDAAQSLTIEESAPAGNSAPEGEATADDRSALEAELASVKAESADRAAEIASLRESLAGLEASLAKALSEARTGHPAMPMHAEEEDDAEAEGSAAPTPSTGRPSRHLIRRLLGLGPGRWETDLDTSSAYPSSPAVVATLAEAKAIVTELRRVPVEIAEESPPAGHHGLPAAVLAPVTVECAPSESEWESLNDAISERDRRIAALEARLREVALPKAYAPEPPVAGADAESSLSPVIFVPAGVILAGDRLPDRQGETVLFSGIDPEKWALPGSADKEGADAAATPLPADTGYLRLTRLDTGESVVGAISVTELLAGGDPKAKQGWSGRVEQYFGACHLGFFDESLPREVETRFGAGGWGFGHRADGSNGQAYAWAGRQIVDFTAGFEISVGPRSRWAEAAPEPLSLPLTDAVTELPAPEVVASESPADDAAPTEPVAATGPLEAERDHLRALSDNRVSGLVVFRSNDPTLWGNEVYTGMNRRSRRLDWLPEGLAYLRLRRIDTGEGLVAPVTNAQLTDDGDGQNRGFNGANEFFYGAHHLGFFDEALPQDFETRFTFGGWGFGHASTGPERQACGWAGREISAGTVFEIAVFRRMPVLAEKDRLWDEAG